MLSLRPKAGELVFQLFGRPLHPELFEPCGARSFDRGGYAVTVAITSGGHVVTWRHGGLTLTAEGFTARAEQATLDRRTGEMRLTGHPELVRGADRLEGERILFWPETGRVVVEKARGRVQLPKLRPPVVPHGP